MMSRIDGDNVIGLNNSDDLGYSIRKKETIKNRAQDKLKNKQSINPQVNTKETTESKIQRANTLVPNAPKPKQ